MIKSTHTNDAINTRRIIYTPSVFARKSMLFLQEAGSTVTLSPHISRRKYLSSYLFFIVLRGSGTVQYEDNLYSLQTGDCVFIDCHKQYSHNTANDLWEIMWVHFDGENMNELYDNYFPRHGLMHFHSDNFSKYMDLLESIYNIAVEDTSTKDLMIYEKLLILINSILDDKRKQDSDGFTSATLKNKLLPVKEYIDLHYRDSLSLDDLSAMFYINKFYLERLFKEEYGLPVKSYIIQEKITHAKHLLRFSKHSMDDIAIECGFSDANYFTRVFKKTEGITPVKFRKNWAE